MGSLVITGYPFIVILDMLCGLYFYFFKITINGAKS